MAIFTDHLDVPKYGTVTFKTPASDLIPAGAKLLSQEPLHKPYPSYTYQVARDTYALDGAGQPDLQVSHYVYADGSTDREYWFKTPDGATPSIDSSFNEQNDSGKITSMYQFTDDGTNPMRLEPPTQINVNDRNGDGLPDAELDLVMQNGQPVWHEMRDDNFNGTINVDTTRPA